MMDIDAEGMIAEYGGSYTLERRTRSTYTDGIAVTNPPAKTPILACFWPASGRDLQRLSEGRRAVETRAGVTTTELTVGGQGSRYEADRVEIDGVAWEVQQVQTWPNMPGFWGVILQRPNVP